VSSVAPGWYKDPAEPTTQRYWDGEGWVGPALPLDVRPPDEPPHPGPHGGSGPVRTSPTPRADTEPGPAVSPDTAGRPPTGGSAPVGSAPPVPAHLPPGAPIPPEWVYRRPAPPPMPHGLRLATPGARLVARLVDFAAILGLALMANAWFLYRLVRELPGVLEEASRGAEPATANEVSTLIWVIALISAAVWLAYEVPAMASSGQTPGKRLLSIKVMRVESDERLGVGRALRRWSSLGLPTVLWPCCGVGLLMQLGDCLFVVLDRPLQQALHDRSAHTVVVQLARRGPARPDHPASQEPARRG
jgi:uncharacterized RDD family membrane protein YckC